VSSPAAGRGYSEIDVAPAALAPNARRARSGLLVTAAAVASPGGPSAGIARAPVAVRLDPRVSALR
jgi:hypothetical protein